MMLGGISIIDFDSSIKSSNCQIFPLRVILHRSDVTVVISKLTRLLMKLEWLLLGVLDVEVFIHRLFFSYFFELR